MKTLIPLLFVCVIFTHWKGGQKRAGKGRFRLRKWRLGKGEHLRIFGDPIKKEMDETTHLIDQLVNQAEVLFDLQIVAVRILELNMPRLCWSAFVDSQREVSIVVLEIFHFGLHR